MRRNTYERFEELFGSRNDYLMTQDLLRAGFTNRQIGTFVSENYLEKISHGIYWYISDKNPKPERYKAIEVSLVDPNVVISSASACYLHGLLDKEPEKFSVVTRRSDRHKFTMNFPMHRHFVSDNIFEEGIEEHEEAGKKFLMYDRERSVCDFIKYEKNASPEVIITLIDRIRQDGKESEERLGRYAKLLRLSKRRVYDI